VTGGLVFLHEEVRPIAAIRERMATMVPRLFFMYCGVIQTNINK
jgi:hypothetical protein